MALSLRSVAAYSALVGNKKNNCSSHGPRLLSCVRAELNQRPAAVSASGGSRKALLAVPVAACLALSLISPIPVEAGILSGINGLESIELPSLPKADYFQKIQEENKKKYEAYDAKFKSSPLLQELLKRSQENAAKHKQEIQDKYCERGADWGVGDCSLAAMSQEQREAFMEKFKKSGTSQ